MNNSRYTRMSSRKQYDASGDAGDEIDEWIQDISDKTKANSPLETKQNALKAITKIMETILYAEGTLAKEVRKGLWETSTPNLMKRILESMTAEQRISVGKLRVDTEGGSAEESDPLVHKIWSVWDDAGMSCQKGLTGVLRLMGEDEGSNPFRQD